MFRIQDDYPIICQLYYISFVEYMHAAKTLLDYTNLFSLNDYKKYDKIMYKYFKDKYNTSLGQTEKVDEIRNYLLEGIKNNDLMGEKHRKTFKCLKYVEHLLIFSFNSY